MPLRSWKPCHHPGCKELIREENYCARHNQEHQAEYEQKRDSAASRGYDAKWRRLRKMYLRAHPICTDPFKDHSKQLVVATEVDHVIPISDGGTDDWDNLQGLCKPCHSKKGAKDGHRWGRGKKISRAPAKRPVGQAYERDREIGSGG